MKLLVLSAIDPGAIEQLRTRHDVVCVFNLRNADLKSYIRDREALIFRSGVDISRDLMAGAPALKLLIRAGSGLDNVDVEYIRATGIKLVRIPGPGAQAVAELTFALMLGLARNVLVGDRLLRQGRWAKNELIGHLIAGKTLGIIGVGNIGTRVGQLGVALGMHPMGCVEYPSTQRASMLRDKGLELTDFDNVVSNADFLSVHVPLKESTYHLVDAAALSRMKPGAFLINVARGGVVDEEALYNELTKGGRLRAAALDVHKEEGDGKVSPLAGLSNVILTPHIGAMTIDSQREIGRRVIEIVDSFAAGNAEDVRELTA